MRSLRLLSILALATVFSTVFVVAEGSDSGHAADRLIAGFAEDASVVDRQWWEAQATTADYDGFDANLITGIVAFQPWDDVELGGRVAFGSTDAEGGGPDGSGATDLEVFGKYLLGGGNDTTFAVGGVLTVPTGDETAGLGSDSFGVSAFGSLRHQMKRLIMTAFAAIQFNGDGRRLGETSDRDGETAPQVGVGVLMPLTDSITGVGEFIYRDARLDGDDAAASVHGGINWHLNRRGMIRASLGFGLDDGAPDFTALVGWASQF